MRFRLGVETHPAATASNWVRIPWPVHLPPASFRFRLATDTLALGYGRRSPAPVRDSHPKDDAHAGRTQAKARPHAVGLLVMDDSLHEGYILIAMHLTRVKK
ncbi:hypothetical protein [Paenibacillus brasilensis]|uniref:Uncharacterized protein n=1 Tax=Paenibacillus brasilensis TaxID=128574 RepID=A0ABU0L5H1_9BACL|nr:hypothetical protein [Paenibacillus brasilensis]MDQ0496553.1 hypothetical protein [Paenibacillus brasilensis]